jgi:hypothetical protein
LFAAHWRPIAISAIAFLQSRKKISVLNILKEVLHHRSVRTSGTRLVNTFMQFLECGDVNDGSESSATE